MLLTFKINYLALPDEHLSIEGDIWFADGNRTSFSCAMQQKGEGNWEFTMPMEPLGQTVVYSYVLKNNLQTVRNEWGNPRMYVCRRAFDKQIVEDCWQELPASAPFYTSAFTETFFRRPLTEVDSARRNGKNITIKVWAPTVKPNEHVVMCGNEEWLGDWNPLNAPRMECDRFPEWSFTFSSELPRKLLQFKFAIINSDAREVVQWEQGEDRMLPIDKLQSAHCYTLSGLRFRCDNFNWRAAGVAIPVFSLRSEASNGIGDFNDLLLLVDWAVKTGLKIVQILPINDTTMSRTWQDSYPYNANSIYALNPIYLHLKEIGSLRDANRMAEYDQQSVQLNRLAEIDYEAVSRMKWSYFYDIFEQEGESTMASDSFKRFFEQNREWLLPYAAFCFLRDEYHTPDFHQWGLYATYNPTVIQELFNPDSPLYRKVAIHLYLQYHLHTQLLGAREHARLSGVIFKGDIPIGISRNSVEAWTEPRLFHLESQAGAPPDPFSTTGQNWGFPTYNWEEMAKDNYAWWRKRFVKMADYFDAYRIDHILGFFRIWEIPCDSVQGLLGYFNPAMPMSLNEIEAAGFPPEYVSTHPYIRRWYLDDLFGEFAKEVIDLFLDRPEPTFYRVKPTFDTQRKVEAYFAGKTDDRSNRIREGMYSLLNNVLFVADPHKPLHYHPRISAQDSVVYHALEQSHKEAFDRLYNTFYYHRHNEFWKRKAYEKLPTLVYATSMMACAEDLGMIPSCVPEVLNVMQIHSLEVERMPKEPYRVFANVSAYPYLSVCTTSTHDMATLRLWWEESRDLSQQYFRDVLMQSGNAPAECTPEICRAIVGRHLQAPSMLTILPLQDWLSIDPELRRSDYRNERINIPACSRFYWRYRMHLSLEYLNGAASYNDELRELIECNQRTEYK